MTVFDLVKSLSAAELRDMRKWIRSEWFNLRPDLGPFFETLAKAAQAGKPMPEKRKIHEQLYPSKPFSDAQIRLLGAWLTDLIEDYWVFQAVERDRATRHFLLSKAYEAHDLTKNGAKSLQIAAAELEKEPLRNRDFFRKKLLLETEIFERQSADRPEIAGLQELSDALDAAFFAQKLQLACSGLSHRAFQKKDFDLGFLAEVLAEAEAKKWIEIPAIGVYFFAFRTLSATDESPETASNFDRLQAILTENGHFFPPDELRGLYLALINFCTRRMNEGHEIWLRRGFELYREGIERRILFDKKGLSPFTFRNAATIGLRLREFAWVRSFLEAFGPSLEPSIRDATLALAFARLEHAEGRFDAALLRLRDVQPSDVLGQLAAKSLVLKVFFDQKAFEALDSHLEAMRVFIRRHSEIGYHGEHYLNLIHFSKALMRIDPSDSRGRKKLAAEIAATAALTEKTWLLEKARS